jgi:hypothetical protein
LGYEIRIKVGDDLVNWQMDVTVDDGTTATNQDVGNVLGWAQAKFAPRQRLPTISEEKAACERHEAECALPSGWEATPDGVSVRNVIGGPTVYTRNFRREDDAVTEAPVSKDGAPVPETRKALLAYDSDHPRGVS